MHVLDEVPDPPTGGSIHAAAWRSEQPGRRGMSDRHIPRLCRSCDAPMDRQEDTCWRCGATWDYGTPAARATGTIAERATAAAGSASPAPGGTERAGIQGDSDHWDDDGGPGPTDG